jgi:hypothetical protein
LVENTRRIVRTRKDRNTARTIAQGEAALKAEGRAEYRRRVVGRFLPALSFADTENRTRGGSSPPEAGDAATALDRGGAADRVAELEPMGEMARGGTGAADEYR